MISIDYRSTNRVQINVSNFLLQLIYPLFLLNILAGVLWHMAINVLFKGIYCRHLSISLLVPVLAKPSLTSHLQV